MIKANGVTKKFGDFYALDELCLNAEKGSVYGLVGPNGAGKTTFIKCLLGIYKQNDGEITVDGLDPVMRKAMWGIVLEKVANCKGNGRGVNFSLNTSEKYWPSAIKKFIEE